MEVLQNYSLLKHNTFGLNVYANRFVELYSVAEIRSFLLSEPDSAFPFLVIGGGSNLLFLSNYPGTVLHIGIKGFEIVNQTDEYVDVRVGAGEVWDDFVAYTVEKGWYGAENLSYIPGEVGASAVQNIGAYGVEAKDLILSVHTICLETAEEHVFFNRDCKYAYRYSIFKGELRGKYLVTSVEYRLMKKPVWHLDYGNIRSILERKQCALNLSNLRNAIIEIRKQKLPDPKELGNAGSFFMNPIVSNDKFKQLLMFYPDMPSYPAEHNMVKIPAGWLIDQCGWKGRSLGRAGVYVHQALVLVNLGGAVGSDIIRLAEAIISSVYEKFGIRIAPEVNYIGG